MPKWVTRRSWRANSGRRLLAPRTTRMPSGHERSPNNGPATTVMFRAAIIPRPIAALRKIPVRSRASSPPKLTSTRGCRALPRRERPVTVRRPRYESEAVFAGIPAGNPRQGIDEIGGRPTRFTAIVEADHGPEPIERRELRECRAPLVDEHEVPSPAFGRGIDDPRSQRRGNFPEQILEETEGIVIEPARVECAAPAEHAREPYVAHEMTHALPAAARGHEQVPSHRVSHWLALPCRRRGTTPLPRPIRGVLRDTRPRTAGSPVRNPRPCRRSPAPRACGSPEVPALRRC